MTAISNSTADAKANAAAYTRSLFDLLGDRDPLEVMTATPIDIRDVVQSVDDKALRRPEREGKWSMLQVAQHLADVEVVLSWRIRLVLGADDPPIHGFDQDEWVARLWRGDESFVDVLDQFSAQRAANLRLLRRLTPREWDRAGIHSERGRESVRHMTKMAGGHDLAHRAQLRRIREAVR